MNDKNLHLSFCFVSRTFAKHYIYVHVCDNLFVQNEKTIRVLYAPVHGTDNSQFFNVLTDERRQSFKFGLALIFF